MNSLKAIEKDALRRRQTYKAVLSNPYVNEEHLWPRVADQALVVQLLQKHVLNKVAQLRAMGTPLDQWPLRVHTEFNDIYNWLQDAAPGSSALLFACNKDADIPQVLMQQVPLLAAVSKCAVTLVQLPRGSLATVQKSIGLPCGLLLLPQEHADPAFMKQVAALTDPQDAPWLQATEYKPADVKLVKSSAPLK
ncbi:Pop3 protein [Maudiozyma humilis]|uniref:Pop3 protein n=1 Tax=Maudiozyma humilis TaxID=51915 RepID=A0AAV5S0B6_MAUHU|nr:Pop3 protein [Kazachstania humilis]